MRSLRSSPQAAGNDAARPARDGAVPAAEAGATGGDDWAICCSGGGIRSAAYCLGALQSLDSGGLLKTAKWIVGVSGGSYIASSRALVAHDLPPGTVPHAYAPGTAEERNFRDNTRYIAPNGATVAGRCPVTAARRDRHVHHRGRPRLRVHARLGLAVALAGRAGPVRAARR